MKYPNVARAVFERPWAILPSYLDVIAEIVEMRIAGDRFTPDEIRARVGTEAGREPILARAPGTQSAGGAVAILPLYGVIFPRANLFSEMSGGTSLQRFTQAFRQAVNDPGISAIVFDVDSPGGQADGLDELAAEIRASRGRKPMVAVANHMMASAAYYLGSATDEVVAAPGAEVGSIGVRMKHVEVSRANDAAGITVTEIAAGRFKTEVSSDAPLSDDARAHLQTLVDESYELFVNAVAKGRGVSAATVRRDYGEGRWFMPREALRRGMIDRVESLDATVARMLKTGRPAARQAMLPDDATLEAIAAEEGIDALGAGAAEPAIEAPAADAQAAEIELERERFGWG